MAREQWGSRVGFILAAVGSAVGLGNIWGFPYRAFSNGGGAFFIPYLFALLTAGIPIMILELAMGQKNQGAAPLTFAKLNRKWEWLGWMQTFISFVIAVYYVAIIGWAIAYSYFSFSQAWGEDTKGFLFGNYLGVTSSQFELGGLQLGVLVPLIIAWIVIYAALRGGVKKGIEFANKIFMPLLALFLVIIAIRGVTLPGASQGLNFLFKPDFSRIFDFNVWTAAYGQIFFSLSICFAIMITYSSYLPKKTDIVNNGFMVSLLNCSFSLLAGFAVFGVLGFMAQSQGVGVQDVAAGGVGLAFVVFPKAISMMPFAPGFFGFLFFTCLVFAGLSSAISINEAVLSGFMDKFSVSRKRAVNVYCVIAFVVSLLFATGAGLLILDVVDHFIMQIAIVFAGLIEVIMVAWFFNLDSIKDHINPMSEFKVGAWWDFMLKIVTPLVLGYMGVNQLISDLTTNYGEYTTSAIVVFGWLVVLGTLVLGLTMQFIGWKDEKLLSPNVLNSQS
ncbi:MAG: neurotransmitter:Na+ symporter, family [Clostridia bacterium]|nr:neurotransmitter:Na+ symporter, family [Clostridia bacterium]